MDAFYERRTAKRIKYKATVMIEIRDAGIFHYATMNNLSGDGVYCGSDFALKLGTAITIRLDNQPFGSAPKIYLGKVLRCEELRGISDSHFYGLGIRIIEAICD
ncbi:MAG: PilZ domain-containing protein [Desulfobacterales bacterium]